MDGVNSREVCQRKVWVVNLSLTRPCHCLNEQCAKFNLDQKKEKCLYYNWKEVGWINGQLLFSYLNLLETISIILSLLRAIWLSKSWRDNLFTPAQCLKRIPILLCALKVQLQVRLWFFGSDRSPRNANVSLSVCLFDDKCSRAHNLNLLVMITSG